MAYTVHNAMVTCGVDDLLLFNGSSAATRIATECFDDDFSSCLDKTMKELDDDLSTYFGLTTTNGRIRVSPGTKKNLKAFVQWCRDKIRTDEDPSQEVFPVENTADLLRRYKSHEAFITKSKTITETAKPSSFKTNSK